jgi:hypothetical protein
VSDYKPLPGQTSLWHGIGSDDLQGQKDLFDCDLGPATCRVPPIADPSHDEAIPENPNLRPYAGPVPPNERIR